MKLGSDGADAELVQKLGPEAAALQTKSNVLTMAEVPLEKTELRAMLKHQLEYYFSRDNLSKDGYLLSQMDSEHYVPISVIANFNQVRKLTSDMNIIVQVLRESLQVQVDEKGEKVRPAFQRSIVILRETPDDTTEEDIRELFAAQSCPKLVGCEYASSNCWYAMFDSEEDAQQAFHYVREGGRTIKGKTVLARLKGKPSSTPLVLRAPPRAVTMAPGENVHSLHRQSMVPSQQQQPLVAASQPLVSSQQSLQQAIIMPHPPVAQQPPPQAQTQQQSQQQLPLLLQSPQQAPINRQYLTMGTVGNVGSMQAPPQRFAVSPSQPGIGNVIFAPGHMYIPSVLPGWPQPNWHQPDPSLVLDMHHSPYHQPLPSSAQLFMPSPGAASGSSHQNYRHQRPQSQSSRVNRGGGTQVANQGPGRQSNNPANSGVFDRHFRNTGSGYQSRGPAPGVVNGHGQPPTKREVQSASGMRPDRRAMRPVNSKGTRRSAIEDQGVTTTSDSHLASGASGLAGAQPLADAAAAAVAATVVLEPAATSAAIVPPVSVAASPAFDLDSCSSFPALPGMTSPKAGAAAAAAGEDRVVLSESLSCLRINPSGRPAVPHDSSSGSSVGRGDVPKPSSQSPAQLPQGLSTSAVASSLETKAKEPMPVIQFGFDMPSEDSTDIGSPDDRPGKEQAPVHSGIPKHTYPVAPGESRTLEASLGSAQSVASSVLDFGPAGILQTHSSKLTYAAMAQKVPAKDGVSMPSEKAGFVVAAVSTGIDESVLQVPLTSALASGSALSGVGPANSNVELTSIVHPGPPSSVHVAGPNRRHDTANVPPTSDLRKDTESQGKSELRQKPPTLVVAATATATT